MILFANCHLTVAAVEMKGEALSVIYEEQGSACFCALVDRA